MIELSKRTGIDMEITNKNHRAIVAGSRGMIQQQRLFPVQPPATR